MFYIGLDVHCNRILACVLDKNGKRVERRCFFDHGRLLCWLKSLTQPIHICFEASTGYGAYYDLFSAFAERVVVAHPGQLRLIFRSKKKNDRVDAEKLAKLLFLDEIPAVYVPGADVRAWRKLITFRKRTMEKRTRAKNEIRALLRTLHIETPKKPGLWSKTGMAWLSKLEFKQSMHTIERDLLVSEINELTRQLRRIEAELTKYSKDDPAVMLLQTIPGVGPRTAEAFVAYVDDPNRFRSSKNIGAYFGLVPSQDQSGKVNRLGRITKEGPATVRYLLGEAVWQAVRRSETIKAYYQRVHGEDPERRKKAIVATAHYLARVMWSMLKNNRAWSESVEKLDTAA